jgi:type I restriction enzyme M protein
VKIDNVRQNNYALTPGRYVGASDDGGDDESFEERFPTLKTALLSELDSARKLDELIRAQLAEFSSDYGA